MARPSSRRPGVNRRAQYGLFASYVITIACAIAGLLLVLVSVADPAGFSVLRAGAATLTSPVASALKSMVRSFGTIDEQIIAYIDAGSQNAALRRQVEANRVKLIEAEAVAQENSRLKKLLQLTQETDNKVATARMISSSSTISRRLARINTGSVAGVLAGMPVRAPEGLVGRVLIVGPRSADILLLTDSQNIVPVRRARDNIGAISTGRDDGTVEIRPLSAGANPFRPGDIVVTTGTGGIYRPNIPVAIIVALRDGYAIGVPLANPARVELVMVERAYDANIPAPVVQSKTEAPASEAAVQ
ncbi:rod shape-determining protein MreC [Sphingobium fluviale]|uniref:Cell shape-determining protein MreC n=1 Tax=Sphingobium fluviale TaxID=2506423 RepID=A0A4Q1KH41_9SPHN|nr:rod shape-determining protein MreC [Sphingobium fluviale]RXR28560.1 rod shape-determining protein MreC [Sphingobium fluviale]